MRLDIIKMAIRKNVLYSMLQLVIVYIALPIVSYVTLLEYPREQSCRVVVFVAQTLLPIFSMLLPISHFNIWLFNEGRESLIACSSKHRTCLGEVVILCLGMLLILLPAWGLFCCCYGFLWLELIRLFSQCCFVITSYYACTVLAKNVTLGAVPIILYLFMCICVSSKSGFEDLSIMELYELASYDSMRKYCIIFAFSGIFTCIGTMLEHISIRRMSR